MLDKKILISIIVPVYNAEHYLEECFRSLIDQSFKSFEIILVDDESKDCSGKMCDCYAMEYENVKVVHQKNGGQSSARKAGLLVAEGEWVTFVDSDDSLPPGALDSLYGAASVDTDIVVGFAFESVEPQHVIEIEDWRKALIKSDNILCTPWGKLFRYSIMSPGQFELVTPNRTASDMPMNIKIAYSTVKPVVVIHPQVYKYNIRNDSLSKTAKWSISKISNLYADVLNSIPESSRKEVLPELVENRIIALKRKNVESSLFGREKISESGFVKLLKKDIQKCSYPLSCSEKMLVKHPDSVMTFSMIKAGHFLLRTKQFIKRFF